MSLDEDILDGDIPLSPLSPLSPFCFSQSSLSSQPSKDTDTPVQSATIPDAATSTTTASNPIKDQSTTSTTTPSDSSLVHPGTYPSISNFSTQWSHFPYFQPNCAPFPFPQPPPPGTQPVQIPFFPFPASPYVNPEPTIPATTDITPSTTPTVSAPQSQEAKRPRKRKSSELSPTLLSISKYKQLVSEGKDELEVVEMILNNPDGCTSQQLNELKKRRRLLKNRNSASLSRARRRCEFDVMKKELTQLKQQYESLKQQNLILSQENRHLQQTVGYFQQWIQAVSNSGISSKTPPAPSSLIDQKENPKTSIVPYEKPRKEPRTEMSNNCLFGEVEEEGLDLEET
ncbi:hypothetical protein P9112_004267 [Eukaryota sp. TZLM1-RC]